MWFEHPTGGCPSFTARSCEGTSRSGCPVVLAKFLGNWLTGVRADPEVAGLLASMGFDARVILGLPALVQVTRWSDHILAGRDRRACSGLLVGRDALLVLARASFVDGLVVLHVASPPMQRPDMA